MSGYYWLGWAILTIVERRSIHRLVAELARHEATNRPLGGRPVSGQGLSAEEREVLTSAVDKYLGGGIIGWLTRLREGWANAPAHWPTLTPAGDYAGCSCGEVGCDKPLFLLHIENLRAAYEAKVQDVARETARLAQVTAERNAAEAKVAAVRAVAVEFDQRWASMSVREVAARLRAALDPPGEAQGGGS